MKDCKFKRKGSTIFNMVDTSHTNYKSVNAAKRESRKIQQSNGGLGGEY